jgi:hypothetical protein
MATQGTSQKTKPAGTGFSNGLYIKLANGSYQPIANALGGGIYTANSVVNAPGLHIVGGSASPLVTNTNKFVARDNGVYGVTVAAAATFPVLNGGNLATANTRVYTFFDSVNATTGANTLSVVAGADFASTRQPATTDFVFGDTTQAIVGYLIVTNASGANFVPGTTNLDATGITATFIDGNQMSVL